MSATRIINGLSSSERNALPRIYTAASTWHPSGESGAMPMIIIAGMPCHLAWGADYPLPAAAHV